MRASLRREASASASLKLNASTVVCCRLRRRLSAYSGSRIQAFAVSQASERRWARWWSSSFSTWRPRRQPGRHRGPRRHFGDVLPGRVRLHNQAVGDSRWSGCGDVGARVRPAANRIPMTACDRRATAERRRRRPTSDRRLKVQPTEYRSRRRPGTSSDPAPSPATPAIVDFAGRPPGRLRTGRPRQSCGAPPTRAQSGPVRPRGRRRSPRERRGPAEPPGRPD